MPKAKPKSKAMPKSNQKITSVWQLAKGAVMTIKQHPKLLWIVAIILVPTTLLTSTGGNASTDSSGFTTMASILMNLALIWAIIELAENRPITIKDAYYKGTAAFVQFMLVALLLVLMLLPLIFGMAIVGLGILPASAQLPERILLGLLAILLCAPTVYWLTRNVFALFIVCESQTSPLAAIRRSKQLVKGRFLAVFGRLAAAAGILVLLGAISTVLPIVARIESKTVVAGLQLLTGLAGLPFLNLYLHRLYRSL